MQTSAPRSSTSAAAPPRVPQGGMTADDNGLVTNSSPENSPNPQRNTYASLPGLAPSKPLSPEALGAPASSSSSNSTNLNNNNGPRYVNTSRRNTMPEMDWHTPPMSAANSMDKAAIAAHAASEPRHSTATSASRVSLNSTSANNNNGLPGMQPSISTATVRTMLPPVAGAGWASSSNTTPSLPGQIVTVGAGRTNVAITRSARIPLALSTSPSSSTASTPPARKPRTNWTNSTTTTGNALHTAVGGFVASSVSPSSTSPPFSSNKLGSAAERVNPATGVPSRAGFATITNNIDSKPSTTTVAAGTAASANSRKVTPPHERELKKINSAIKTFNQRVLEENEREGARSSHRGSRANSRNASTSVLAVPTTQPPSTGPPPPLKPTTPTATPPLKRSPLDSTAVSQSSSANSTTVRGPPPPLIGGGTPAQTHSPVSSATANSSPTRTRGGTGPKPTPAPPSPVPSTLSTVKSSPAAAPPPLPTSSPPSRNLSGSGGKTNLAFITNVNSSGTNNNTPRASGTASSLRSTESSVEGGATGDGRVSLIEQVPRSGLLLTAPNPSYQSPPAQPSVRELVQAFSMSGRLSGVPKAPANAATSGSGGSQSGQLLVSKAPQQEAPPSIVNSDSGIVNSNNSKTASPQPLSFPCSAKKTTPPTAPSLPSRYSDYNDEANTTPPRVTPSAQSLTNPVYSAVEVQVSVPPTSATASSARRGLAGFAAVFGTAKKDNNGSSVAPDAKTFVSPVNSADTSPSISAKNRVDSNIINNGSVSPGPQLSTAQAAPTGIRKSHTLDDLDDAGEDTTTLSAFDARKANSKSVTGHTPGELTVARMRSDRDRGLVGDDVSFNSNAGGSSRNNNDSTSQRTPPSTVPLRNGEANKSSLAPPVVTVGSTAPSQLPLTALPVFNATDEAQAGRGISLNSSKAEGGGGNAAAAAAPTKASSNQNAAFISPRPVPSLQRSPPQPASTTTTTSVTAARPAGSLKKTPPSPITRAVTTALILANNNNNISSTNRVVSMYPTAAPPTGNNNSAKAGAADPTAATSPPSLVRPSPLSVYGVGGATHARPDSALTRNGRFATSRSRDGQVGGCTSGRDAYQHQVTDVRPSDVDVDAEAATLNTYLKDEELNLSMSTFNSVGLTLAQSLNLRVLNLKGSTIASEGLRGLANIPTLRSVCVSHMRNLTTLNPLVTPTTAGACCEVEEIDAQFSNIGNDGIKSLANVHHLLRLDLSMTPISDVTCLASSRSLNDLYLTGTRVDNAGVAGLEKVPTLITLNIARTKVTSLCQLSKSRSIQTLILYSCQVNDAGFVGVGEMPRLTTVDVSTTKIEDLSVLQKSRSLKSVKAQWMSLKNCQDIIQERRSQMDGPPPGDSTEWRDTEAGFAGLAAIATLETLDLSFNTLRSIHSLCRSKSIKHLYLKRTRVENAGIGSIAQLAPTLETLVITNLTDSLDDEDDEHEFDSNTCGLLSLIGDIHLLNHLTLLDLSYTDVFDLRLLQNISTLKQLVIVETLVTVDGLRGIERIPSLELLDISQTSILSLQFLVGGAPALKKILARSNRNTSGFVLGQVHKLPALEHLDLSDSVVEDMETVPKKSWRLKELVWRWGERRDNKGLAPLLECWVTSPRLVGLRDMPCLSFLDLTSSRVHELEFLVNAPCLKTLYLKLCKLLRNSTIHNLGTLAALEVLQLSDNTHITDVTCLRSCRRLRELHLNNTRVSTKGLEGVLSLPELKVLNIANTRAEDEALSGGKAVERSRMLEDSNLRDVSVVLENTATPAQFRLPRRRRVSFIANEGGDTSSKVS